MTEMTTNTPNADSAANVQSAVPSMDAIAAKMTAMREQTLRNQIGQQPAQTATGEDESAETTSSVAPSDAGAEVADTSDTEFASDDQNVEAQPEEAVSDSNNDSTAEELIDFIEFAETNPNAKFKFMRNGKEVVIDAKKAESVLLFIVIFIAFNKL